ncbi:MAG: N-acetylneuraminate synthase family protein [Candidatus Coatesbacteria bacterium]|nr:N-acetylneuraminate synthase family protein [Candidatus Coatesbacteria bacterium]
MDSFIPVLSRIKVGKHWIGEEDPTLIVCDIALNHGKDKNLLEELVNLCAHSNASAIILPVFHPEDYCSPNVHLSNSEYAFLPNSDKILFHDFLEEYAIPPLWIRDISKICKDLGLSLLVRPGCIRCAEFSQRFKISGFVLDSMELNNYHFQKELAQLGMPILVNIGMGLFREIENATKNITKNGNQQVALIHSPSHMNGNTEKEDANIKVIPTLANLYNTPVGYFDKSLSLSTCMGAVALGARIIIKRVALSRKHPVPDAAFALEPSEVGYLAYEIRQLEANLGSSRRSLSKMDLALRKLLRRSIVAKRELPAGTIITQDNIKICRPGTGIEPEHWKEILGFKLSKRVKEGEPITWEDFQVK